MPAHFIAFDVLQIEGRELLSEPYERRRGILVKICSPSMVLRRSGRCVR
ncbi:hypothetical protein ACIHCQ_32250 [Streptomyces sp. NPDC052236]